tara:strand:+ start:145 stop:435 length:291 start_codon:yes stop_codon:yes gene_type:complete
MGQFGNQPDFGTFAKDVTASDAIGFATNVGSACLYIGTGGDVTAILAGVTGAAGSGLPTATEAILFKNIPDGSFLPVIVDYVLATGTTATNIVAIK